MNRSFTLGGPEHGTTAIPRTDRIVVSLLATVLAWSRIELSSLSSRVTPQRRGSGADSGAHPGRLLDRQCADAVDEVLWRVQPRPCRVPDAQTRREGSRHARVRSCHGRLDHDQGLDVAGHTQAPAIGAGKSGRRVRETPCREIPRCLHEGDAVNAGRAMRPERIVTRRLSTSS